MQNVLIVGATSAIAIAVGRLFANTGSRLFLIGRHVDHLNEIKSDLMARGALDVHLSSCELTEIDRHADIINSVIATLGFIDVAVIAHGTLTDQVRAQIDTLYIDREIQTNATSVITITSLIANHMEERQQGGICVISSVAGDRGRKSNYIYGAAKSAVTTFCQGLRNRLYPHVCVITIKPGFVITPMTKSFKKGLMWVQPEVVAGDIFYAIQKRRMVVYTPWFWRWIMMIIRFIPESIFRKLSL